MNKVMISIFLSILAIGIYNFFLNTNKNTVAGTSTFPINTASSAVFATSTKPILSSTVANKVSLNVPYIPEAPGNDWTGPWKNACEEASITMVDNYYQGKSTINIADGKSFMEKLFTAENKIFNSNANEDSARANYMISNYTSFKGNVVTNPTIEQIKEQLREGHPVIAFHYGFALKNKNIPFLATGSSYHSTVIVGYDDTKNVFIVNDPGDETYGKNHLYNYTLYMSSFHDYNYNDKKADGPARVIFTSN